MGSAERSLCPRHCVGLGGGGGEGGMAARAALPRKPGDRPPQPDRSPPKVWSPPKAWRNPPSCVPPPGPLSSAVLGFIGWKAMTVCVPEVRRGGVPALICGGGTRQSPHSVSPSSRCSVPQGGGAQAVKSPPPPPGPEAVVMGAAPARPWGAGGWLRRSPEEVGGPWKGEGGGRAGLRRC